MVEVRELRKAFRKRDAQGNPRGTELTALDGISFTVERGELVSLLGPSGCGKTTLLRIIAGLIPPDEGQALVEGARVTGPRKDRCMVFQHFGLLPWRTVLANVEFPLELDGVSKTERRAAAERCIELVGLRGFEHHYPHELSGGMQQRVGIARALMRKPVLLLMDEPFGALDAQTREQLQEEFLRIWTVTRNTVLFVTHSIDEALVLSSRIVVFTPGPGRIKTVLDVGLDRRAGDVRALPEFGKQRAEIRDLLRSASP
jgi:NitT/TauT family transport system ATP-binding protein